MYGIEHKVLAILFSSGLLLQGLFVRAWLGTYLAPAALFPIVWFLFTFFPLVFLFDVPINPWSILYILLCSIAFSFGALPFNWKAAFKKNKANKSLCPPDFGSLFMRNCLFFSSTLAVIFSILVFIANGWSIEAVLFDLLATSGRFAAIRGTEGMEYGLVGTLSTFFTYLSPVIGGFVFSTQTTTRGRLSIFALAIFPSIFTMVTQSTKLAFLLALCFFLATIMLTNIYKNKLSLFKGFPILKISVGGLLLFPLVLISFVSRGGNAEFIDIADTLSAVKFALASYSLGQIYAFSDFFSFYIGMPAVSVFKDDFNSYGAYTFASIFDMIGKGKDFPPGMYLESGYFSNIFETNIFTAFRGLIYDFGGIGSIIVIFLLSLIAHSFFHELLTHKRPWFASTFYITTIVTVLMMYLFSVFVARYMFLNAFAVYMILNINAKLQRNRHAGVNRRYADRSPDQGLLANH